MKSGFADVTSIPFTAASCNARAAAAKNASQLSPFSTFWLRAGRFQLKVAMPSSSSV